MILIQLKEINALLTNLILYKIFYNQFYTYYS